MSHRWRCVLIVLMVLVGMAGCARKLPQEVTDVNRALGQARDACASVYAVDELSAVRSDVDSMNRLADDKKYKKAGREAEVLMPKVADLKADAERGRSRAKESADAAIREADRAVDAARDAEAPSYATSEFRSAAKKLDEARAAAKDPCKYPRAEELAQQAASAAEKARTAAIAEKRRQEEEARRRAEERRRREEEARRRAEEARRKANPREYVVEKGDYLWKISGMDKIYQAPKFWPLIFDANRGMIRDPDLIYPGQKFNIPRDMSDAEMMSKLELMWWKASRGEL